MRNSGQGEVGLALIQDLHRFAAFLNDDRALVGENNLPGGMNGLELAATIRQRTPDMPILYVSGYSEGSTSESAERDKDSQFLAKPYDNLALACAVRRALAMHGRVSELSATGVIGA